MRASERAAACAILAAGCWAAWDIGRIDRASAPTDITAARRAPPATAVPDADVARQVVERSLFSPSRRADFASVAVRAGAVGGHVLRGVVFGAAGAVALFEPVRGGQARRLRQGGTIGGYRLVTLEEGAVVLERDGARRRIAIDQTGPALAVASPPKAVEPPLPMIRSTPDEVQP